MPQKSPPTRSARQQPGLACEECRKRKARCDRAKPQCGSCMMTGRVCIVNHNRPRRGPKKGQIESLYSRLEVLEDQVVEQLDHTSPGDVGPQNDAQLARDVPQSFSSDIDERQQSPYLLSSSSSAASENVAPPPRPFTAQNFRASYPPGNGSRLDLVQADLDQLYFDRVHSIAPFLHQRRFFSRDGTEPPSLARTCLRSAMRTVAAAMSAQFRRLADSMYTETGRLLHELDTIEVSPPLEQIQALLLLAHYELLRMEESRAMVTAGRCFRLIQLSRLHDTDAYNGGFSSSNMLDFATAEEKRRTFWVAYCFDRFLSSRHEWPLTLQEEAIRTRLPVPENTFQSCQPPELPMDFLHEAIATSGQRALPPFAESIVLATLYGRAMNLRRSALLLNTSQEIRQFWDRHKSLSNVIEKRAHLWSWSSLSPAGLVDPVVAFTHVLGKVALIYIGEVAEIARAQISHDMVDVDADTDTRMSIQAAVDFVQLTRSMGPTNCFKAHPFLPNAISRAAVFLSTHTISEGGAGQRFGEVEELRQILRDLQVVNNLAKQVLRELGGELPV
ncbi:fungal-specific transcription factor domain-containing protein [Aspergillus varians]